MIQRFSFKEFISQLLVNTVLGLIGKLLFFFVFLNLPSLPYCFYYLNPASRKQVTIGMCYMLCYMTENSDVPIHGGDGGRLLITWLICYSLY